jgi:rhodanese-related sulfurtransferase
MTDIRRVSPVEAKQLMDQGFVYVDVRSEPEFAAGHPDGAVNVPIATAGAGGMTPNPDFLRAMEALFAKDAKLVVGCQAGGRSLRAAQELVRAGFTGVVDQRAGFGGARDAFGRTSEPGWQAAGLPIEAGAPEGRSWADVKAKLA